MGNLDFDLLNKEIDEIASKMVDFNTDDINSADVKKAQNIILSRLCEAFYSMRKAYDEYSNEAYYWPPIRQRIETGTFWDTIYKLLGVKDNGEWYFNKKEYGSFMKLLTINLRGAVANYHKKFKRSKNTVSFDSTPETAGESGEPIAPRDFTEQIEKLKLIGDMLELYGQKLEHISENAKTNTDKKAPYFYRGFFTFDTVRAIKSDKDLGEVACEHEYNEILFRHLLINILTFLMIGSFNGMIDVVRNPLREFVNFSQRGEILEKYYEVTHPTLNKYSQLYDKFLGLIYKVSGENKYHSF